MINFIFWAGAVTCGLAALSTLVFLAVGFFTMASEVTYAIRSLKNRGPQ